MSAELISSLALLVSLVSLSFSAYFGLRDRSRLITNASYIYDEEFGVESVRVTYINKGRRPVILTTYGGTSKDNKSSGVFLDYHNKGLKLNENERHELMFNKEDLGCFSYDDNFNYQILWVEDSLGKKHTIKNSKKALLKFWSQ